MSEAQAPPPKATITLWRHMEKVETHWGPIPSWPDAEAGVHWLNGGNFYGFSDGPLRGYIAPFRSPVPKFLKVGIQTGQDETSVTYEEFLYKRGRWVEPCHQMWNLAVSGE
jgi:hypothetical protein